MLKLFWMVTVSRRRGENEEEIEMRKNSYLRHFSRCSYSSLYFFVSAYAFHGCFLRVENRENTPLALSYFSYNGSFQSFFLQEEMKIE